MQAIAWITLPCQWKSDSMVICYNTEKFSKLDSKGVLIHTGARHRIWGGGGGIDAQSNHTAHRFNPLVPTSMIQ